MDLTNTFINNLVCCETVNSVATFLDALDHILNNKISTTKFVITDFVDTEFITEIKTYSRPGTSIYFGNSMRELKCVVDADGKQHEMWLMYKRPKELRISSVNIPRSVIQDRVYKSLDEAITMFKEHISSLVNYFETLDKIDSLFPVMEPSNPTYKDLYRKVDLGNKVWLHLEVMADGTARNMSFVGCYNLEDILRAWDPEKDIVSNINTITDLLREHISKNSIGGNRNNVQEHQQHCEICLSYQLDSESRVPQPLCHNCNTYFHKTCLYESVVSVCSRAPTQLGVATGPCPVCLKPIYCTRDD